jgi:hypothetical protein
MLRVNTKPRHRNSPRIAEKSAPGFLQWLRGRDCYVATHRRVGITSPCSGKIEAAHVDYAGDKGMGSKVSDKYAIPLCGHHHREQHRLGWSLFERGRFGWGGAALSAASQFWRAWPGRIAWERKLEQ